MTDAAAASPEPSRREQAARLAAERRRHFLIGTVVGIAAPFLIWWSGISTEHWRGMTGHPAWLSVPLQVVLVTLILVLVTAPLTYYGGHVLNHRYGLSTQGFGGWLSDWLKGAGLILVFTTLAGSAFYATIWALPAFWWLAFWVEAVGALVLLTFLAPYVIVPLFFKPQPVDDPGLVMMIEELVKRAGTTVAGVSRLDFSRRTNEANAAVIGYGRSRRVVLADTLLDTFPALEIRAVVAHELGHHVHRDVFKMLVTQALVTLVGLALAALVGDRLLALFDAAPMSDPGSYPMLVAGASIFGLLTMPLTNAYARSVEAAADTYAFNLLGDGRPLGSALKRLADQNLGEERPPRWAEILLYTHPPIWRRVERAEAASHG